MAKILWMDRMKRNSTIHIYKDKAQRSNSEIKCSIFDLNFREKEQKLNTIKMALTKAVSHYKNEYKGKKKVFKIFVKLGSLQ